MFQKLSLATHGELPEEKLNMFSCIHTVLNCGFTYKLGGSEQSI
jgi:hypothetical protein